MATKQQLANLRPVRSKEEARERGRKGGKASGETRRLLKTFRELDDENTTDDERLQMLDKLKLLAKKGNINAFVVYRDTVGLKPKENVEISGELKNPYTALTEEELKKLADVDG